MNISNMRREKKAQVWITDVMLSIVLFTAAVLIAIAIILNGLDDNSEFSDVKTDAVRISEYFFTEGLPSNWAQGTVVRPGLFTGQRINSTKVYLAMNLTNSSYSYFKSILQANNEFLVVFESANGTVIPFQNYCAIGNYTGIIDADYTSGVYCHPANFTSVTYTDLVRINRYAVYNSEIVRMVIYSWS